MIQIHTLGFPRIGEKRELKKAIEAYWKGKSSLNNLHAQADAIRLKNLKLQQQAGCSLVPTFDFALYDHVLSTSMLLGLIPERFQALRESLTPTDLMFAIARGHKDATASALTKWFDTNYHYIVPELDAAKNFTLSDESIFKHTEEALSLGIPAKPVLIAPLSYLYLGKFYEGANSWERKLELLPSLISAYQKIIVRLSRLDISWLQLDEPIFAMELPAMVQEALKTCYDKLNHTLRAENARRAAAGKTPLQLMLASYFNNLGTYRELFFSLPVGGYHLDLSKSAAADDTALISACAAQTEKTFSLGIINGRNCWRSELSTLAKRLSPFIAKLPNILLAPSCSLLHAPLTLRHEQQLAPAIRAMLAFAEEKLTELKSLATALKTNANTAASQLSNADTPSLTAAHAAYASPALNAQLSALNLENATIKRTSPFNVRERTQTQTLNLPLYPTTTIGSFPQTQAIRKARSQFKRGQLTQEKYEHFIKTEIQDVITKQEDWGLDVLVHGESERNDMVEYFASYLTGYAFSANGWVQSYGTRCVKPPIIYGDIKRKQAMTVTWSRYAQSLSQKPVKGMLTGPITMLQWSFVREDQPRSTTAYQLALALQEEIQDLEAAQLRVIQLDEPALREGLPLRKTAWPSYLKWATQAFRLCSAKLKDGTQLQTHMCYSDFGDIVEAIIELDADVILIESSRSKMELLKTLTDYNYPAHIGPGIYDIHSPRIPAVAEMVELLECALKVIPNTRLWVTPDCGLKTREWAETEASLKNMVASAHTLRQTHPASA